MFVDGAQFVVRYREGSERRIWSSKKKKKQHRSRNIVAVKNRRYRNIIRYRFIAIVSEIFDAKFIHRSDDR